MALNTYQIVAIFVSILGAAIIFAITWLLYKWARTSHTDARSRAHRSSRPPRGYSHGNMSAHVAPSESTGPPTQRLMVQRGRVVPQRKSASIRSGLSSIRYSGWLASNPHAHQEHAGLRSNYSDTASLYSRASRRLMRRSSSRYTARHSDIESAAGASDVPDVPELPELEAGPEPMIFTAKQVPIRHTVTAMPRYPTVPMLQAPPAAHANPKLRSQHFRPPSIRSMLSSVSTSPATSMFPRNVQPGDSPQLSPSPKRATFTEGSVTPPTPRRAALMSLAMETPTGPRASMPIRMPSSTSTIRPSGPGSPGALQSKFFVPPAPGSSKLARASTAVDSGPYELPGR